jgi:hypothetical protein
MLVFGDKFKQSAAQFGIPTEDARQAIEESDHAERIHFPESGGLALTLYLKAAKWHGLHTRRAGDADWCPPGERLHLLVATVPSVQFEVVNWVLPLPTQIAPDDAAALGALQLLCERFGTEIRLGDTSGRLIRSVIVPGEPGLPLSVDLPKDARPGFGFISSRYDHDRRAFLVALAYVLDVQALRSELMS